MVIYVCPIHRMETQIGHIFAISSQTVMFILAIFTNLAILALYNMATNRPKIWTILVIMQLVGQT